MDWIASTLWAVGLVFARVGAFCMLMPGVGEQSVPARARLGFAFFLSIMLAPLLAQAVPAIPQAMPGLVVMIGQEILIGLLMGAATRFCLGALATAGAIAGLQSGLSMAMQFDPAQGQQGAIFATFLVTMGLALIFAADLHHWFIVGAWGSYERFPLGRFPAWGDIAQFGIQGFSQAFLIGVQITAPLLVFGLLFNFGLGILSKLAPTIQVFFIMMPVQILLGLLVFLLTAGAGMLVWLDYVEQVGRSLG
jgi:flagellar biosynthesis protein FliR